MRPPRIYRYPFAVHEEAYCVWEYDLPDRNRRFLDQLDPKYFGQIVSLAAVDLENEAADRGALLLRSTYHHAMETLFSSLGALAQAPGCVPGWLMKCRTEQLRSVVEMLRTGAPILTQRGRQPTTFDHLATYVTQWCWHDESPPGTTAGRFAMLWHRLANEFLDPVNVAEYNSIKHGLRIAPGGFGLSIGLQPAPDVPAPPEAMQTLGFSKYGASFYREEEVSTAGQKGNRSFRLRSISLNWSPHAMAQRIQLIVFSLKSIVGALRIMNGAAPESVRFSRPDDPAAFDAAWAWHVGINHTDLDVIIEPNNAARTSRQELTNELEGRAG